MIVVGSQSKVEGRSFQLNQAQPLLILSGRHTPFAGSSNIQGGVTIDLAKLNQVDVTGDDTQVSIGSGNRWADVYLKLDALGISTSGGRASTVGVGGLTIGGK